VGFLPAFPLKTYYFWIDRSQSVSVQNLIEPSAREIIGETIGGMVGVVAGGVVLGLLGAVVGNVVGGAIATEVVEQWWYDQRVQE